jgi:hypothetical protein
MHETPGYESSLLPHANRAAVQPLLQPAVAESLHEVCCCWGAVGHLLHLLDLIQPVTVTPLQNTH